MRRYAAVQTSIRYDTEFLALSVRAQHLYVMCLADPELSACGVLAWDPRHLAQVGGDNSVAAVQAAAGELITAGYLVVDGDTGEALVRSYMRNDGQVQHRNNGVAVARAAARVASRGLLAVLAHEVQRLRAEHPDWAGLGVPDWERMLKNQGVPWQQYPCGNPYWEPPGDDGGAGGGGGGGPVGPDVPPAPDSGVTGTTATPSGTPSPTPSGRGLQTPSPTPSETGLRTPRETPSVRGLRTPSDTPSETPSATPKHLNTQMVGVYVPRKGYNTRAREGLPPAPDVSPGPAAGAAGPADAAARAAVAVLPETRCVADSGAEGGEVGPGASEGLPGRPAGRQAASRPPVGDALSGGERVAWGTPEDPRCAQHADLPRDQVPPCGGCAAARRAFAAQATAERERHRAAIAGCDWCDARGMVGTTADDGTPLAVRCTHTGPPPPPPPGPTRRGHRERSSAATRRAALDAARSSARNRNDKGPPAP